MSPDSQTAARIAAVIAICCFASLTWAQSSSSNSFSLESSLLTGAARSTSSNFTAETCVSPGMGGVSSSTNFALTTGCGAALTLSQSERAALGLLEPGPVAVPTTSDLAQVVLPILLALMGWLTLRRRSRSRADTHPGQANLRT